MAIVIDTTHDKWTITPDILRARIDGAPAKTAPPLRSRSQRLWEIAGESPGMKPEPTEIPGKDDETEASARGLDGPEEHWRSQRKLEQVGEPRALGPGWSH